MSTRLVSRPLAGADEAESIPRAIAFDHGMEASLLHDLARSLRHPDVAVRRATVELLRESLAGDRPEMDALVHDVLTSGLTDPGIRGECLRAVLPVCSADELDALVARHLEDPGFLDERDVAVAAGAPLRPDQLDRLVARVHALGREERREGTRILRLVRWIVRHAIEHRDSHLQVRSALAWLADEAPRDDLRARFREWLGELVREFRARLPAVPLAEGVRWEDVVDIRGDVDPAHRARILGALANTPLLVEARTVLGPDAIPKFVPLTAGAIRISYLGRGMNRTVHFLEWIDPAPDPDEAVRFECILKVNDNLSWEDVQKELRLAVRIRSTYARPIVKTHGGGYRDFGLWTEEYVPGLTLDRLVDNLAADQAPTIEGPAGRLPEVWPFLVSSCASLMVDFWRRSGRRERLAHPNPAKVVLPEHDWQIGGRLVSVADRVPCTRLTDVLDSVYRFIVRPMEERHPEVPLPPSWSLLFASALEVMGEREGLEALEAEAPWTTPAGLPGPTPELAPAGERLGAAALRFVSSVKRRGFLPTRIRTAARRWRRWEQLNPNATLEAQAATLDQFEDAYGLAELEAERPGSRLQLFRHTVFRGAGTEIVAALDDLVTRLLSGDLTRDQGRTEVAQLREKLPLDDRGEFFLARALYPHVDPRGRAVLLREEDPRGGPVAGVEVEHRDPNGEIFRIRRPANPNETNALIRIFRASNFRRVPTSPEHDLLVVTEESGRVLGGLIYRRPSATYVVLEWIVVGRHRRGRHIGSVLLGDFLERLKVQGVKAVSTGFFRPGFFAQFGFGLDPRYAGIVKILAESPSGEFPAPSVGSVSAPMSIEEGRSA